MKIQLWSIGKAHDALMKQGIEEFSKRIKKYYSADWKIIMPAKQTTNTTESDIKKNEATSVLQLLQKDDFLVLLDETGKQMSSPQLATFLEKCANTSVKQLVFLIGGAFGVSPEVKQRANFIWSLSPLVFPHQLVRLILAEQIYRACTIIRNEKYHHE